MFFVGILLWHEWQDVRGYDGVWKFPSILVSGYDSEILSKNYEIQWNKNFEKEFSKIFLHPLTYCLLEVWIPYIFKITFIGEFIFLHSYQRYFPNRHSPFCGKEGGEGGRMERVAFNQYSNLKMYETKKASRKIEGLQNREWEQKRG